MAPKEAYQYVSFIAAVTTDQDVTDQEVQVIAQAHQVEEKKKIWKEVMATKAQLNSVWKGNLIVLSTLPHLTSLHLT